MHAVESRRWMILRPVVFGAAVMAPMTVPAQSADSIAVPIDSTITRIDGTLPNGRVIPRIVSRADGNQRYALYLPSSFSRDRRFPVLFLLDPRGRALVPMQRFQPAAERLGYIVISSWNTLSDGPIQPNYSAMNAMMADVQNFLSVDTRRFYLVGFSGTARFAWQMHTQSPGIVAGIVGTGASVPGGRSWIRANIGRNAPVLFGTIGTLDPNYEEMRELDAELDAIGTTHHIERFDGGHQWPPADLSSRAVEWLELTAMRRNIAPRAPQLVDSLFRSWHSQAARLDSAGDAPAAARAYKLVVNDFRGLADVGAVEARLAVLRAEPRVRRSEATEASIAERDAKLVQSLFGFVADLDRSPSPPSVDDARKRLDLDKLRRDAVRTDDSASALAARRWLERVFSHMSFYAPRKLMDGRRYAHAAVALRVARLIKPDDPFTCLSLARALAQTGDKPDAIQALECAAASRQLTAAAVEGDTLLAPLRGDARYGAIIKQLPPGR